MANTYWLLVSRSKNLKYFRTSNCVCIKFRIPYVIVFYVCVVRILKRTNFLYTISMKVAQMIKFCEILVNYLKH